MTDAAAAPAPEKKKGPLAHAPGFIPALEEALLPIMPQEKEYTLEELAEEVGKRILKQAKKYAKDERTNQRGTATIAQVIVSEYVETSMQSVQSSLWEKTWIGEVNFVPPLMRALDYCFQGCKVFSRSVGPSIEKYVETALAQWKEEERIVKAMTECVEQSGIQENHRKKCLEQLQSSYDDAHIKAPYGTNVAETPELGMLQDFVRGWMFEFVKRSHGVLTYGVASDDGKATKDEQVLFVTVLFQNLCDTKNVCLPNDLTSLIPSPPAHPWAYVAEAAEAVFQDIADGKGKEKDDGKGKGGGKGKKGKGDGWSDGWGWTPDPWTMQMMKGMMKGKMMKGSPYDKGFGKGKGWGKGW